MSGILANLLSTFSGKDYKCGVGWSIHECSPKELFLVRLTYSGILLVLILFFTMTVKLLYSLIKHKKLSKLFLMIYSSVFLFVVYMIIQELNPPSIIY